MNNEATRDEYERLGFVRLPGAFPSDAAAAMAEAVRAATDLSVLRRDGAFAGIGTPAVLAAGAALLGDVWQEPDDWGGALVTEPTPGDWKVPASGWHLDYPVRGAPLVELRLKWFGVLRHTRTPDREATLLAGAAVRGVEVRVVELTGEPGDVVLLHPLLLHAATPNNAERTRLMVTGGLEVAR